MSLQINLDENTNFVTSATFTQDIRETHSRCLVVFVSKIRLDFHQGGTFIAWGHEWEAVSCKEVNRGNEFYYSALGYPKEVCNLITRKFSTLSALASGVGVALTKGSSDFSFNFPLTNILLGPLLYKYRYESIEHNISKLSQAWFLFYHNSLTGLSYGSLLSGAVNEFNMNLVVAQGGHYTLVTDSMKVKYDMDHLPSKVSYKNYIGSFIGDKFDVHCRMPGMLGARYILVGGDEDLFSRYDKLILVRQKYDSNKRPIPWTLTFGSLEV